PKKLMPFHKIPLGDWTEEDAREWLDFVGLGHFREQFKDALETANEQDKEKILAVYSALRSPNLSGIELAQTSTGSSSPRDSDAGYHLSSDTASLASSVTASDDISHQGSTEVLSTQAPIFPPQSYQTPRTTSSSEKGKARAGRSGKEDSRVKEKKKRKNKDKKSKCTTSPQPYPETKSRAPPPPIHPAPPAAPPSSTVWYTAGTSSEASSLHGDQDSLTDEHPDHTSEENLTFQASPETNKELDDVLMEALRNDLQIQKMEIQRKDGRIDDLERKLTKTVCMRMRCGC
ncbi:predicted protein, partial [Nematostella vectensis]